MKKCSRYCAEATAYYRMYSTDVYCSKQTGSSSTRNHHPSFLRFWNWAKKTVDAAKICGGAEMLLKQKPTNIRKWIAQFFITLDISTPLEARMYCSQ